MIHNKPFANFSVRFLGTLDPIFYIPHIFFWNFIASSKNSSQFVYNLFLYLVILLIPSHFVFLVFSSFLTSRFGGSVGKLIAGVEVVDKNGHYLSFKKSLFRSFIGYGFSSLLFGLGFWNVITDKEKRAWHDKAIGSYVVVKHKKLWILAFMLAVASFGIYLYFAILAISTFLKGPLPAEFKTLFQTLEEKSAPKTTPQITDYTVGTPFREKQDEIYNLMDQKRYIEAANEQAVLFKMAQTDFEKAVAHRMKGELFFEQGYNEQARSEWLQTISLAPNYAEAYNFLAEVDMKLYRDREALTYARKAVELDGSVAVYHNDLGVALDNLGRTQEGVKEVEKAIELDPKTKLYQDNLVKMEQRLGGKKT